MVGWVELPRQTGRGIYRRLTSLILSILEVLVKGEGIIRKKVEGGRWTVGGSDWRRCGGVRVEKEREEESGLTDKRE